MRYDPATRGASIPVIWSRQRRTVYFNTKCEDGSKATRAFVVVSACDVIANFGSDRGSVPDCKTAGIPACGREAPSWEINPHKRATVL